MKQAVITGAADGIGKALAGRFAKAGYAITGLDIDDKRAQQTQTELEHTGAEVSFIIADLASETEIDLMLAKLETRPPIDIFIHNAGINTVGRFADSRLSEQKRVIQVNMLAPMLLTAGLLRQKKVLPHSSLVFISSLSHYAGYPGAAVYAAAKDGLASYARSLSVSLAGQDIHVLTVYPGPTRTTHARRYSPDNSREHSRMPPEQLADKIFKAVQTRRRVLTPGLGNKLFAALGHYFPRLTEAILQIRNFRQAGCPTNKY